MAEHAHPPETAEGWYALHQIFTVDRRALRALDGDQLARIKREAVEGLHRLTERSGAGAPGQGGWSVVVSLIGSPGDVMLVHFRETLDALGDAQAALARERLFDFLAPAYSFLSVTEAGFYHLTAEAVRETEAAGGKHGDAAYTAKLAERVERELQSQHVQRRLYPPIPPEMPYVCFYPMSKRRDVQQNWYTLTLDERSRLMMAHGLTGRRYAGKVVQIITGAIGLAAWEWGVTLFAKVPVEFKRLVSDLRFDEVSATYAEFGEFYVGRLVDGAAWVASLG
jgi:chlorite dismutase